MDYTYTVHSQSIAESYNLSAPFCCSPLKEKATYKSLTDRCLHIPQLFTYTYNVQALPGVMSAFTMKQVRTPLHVKIINIKGRENGWNMT